MSRKKRPIPLPAECPKNYLADMTLERSIAESKERAIQCLDEHNFDADMGSTQMFIVNQVIQPMDYFILTKYKRKNVEDYELAFQTFREIIVEINKHIPFTPTLNTLCRFLNMSSDNYGNIVRENGELGELFKTMKDSLADNLMQNMLANRIGAPQGIFIAKANFGMRDDDPANINIVNVNSQREQSLEEILAEFNKKGY